MTILSVAQGGAHYEVRIGDLEDALAAIDSIAGGRLLPIVSDAHVFGLHGHRLKDVAALPPILVPAGEAAKDWDGLRLVIDGLAARGATRGTPLIALGGGSVGDLTGLAAALYMRGNPVIQIPTTLLAQVDSAVGGKTAIDAGGVKNLVGLFHPPALVVIDPSLTDTLDERQRTAGYAEIVKYGLIDDPDFFAWCETHGRAVIAGDPASRRHAIAHSVAAKARIVTADPEEKTGLRALLNLGHSFGHAVEAASENLAHGEAVAVGMATAFRFSVDKNLCPPADLARLERHLADVGLPTRIADTGVDRRVLADLMALDKKNGAKGLTLILARGIGRAFVERGVERTILADFLARAP